MGNWGFSAREFSRTLAQLGHVGGHWHVRIGSEERADFPLKFDLVHRWRHLMINVGLAVLSRCGEGGHNGDGRIAHAWLLLLTLGCRDVVHGEEVKVRADGRERRLGVWAIAQTAAAATNGTVTKERTLEVIKLLHQLKIRQFLLKFCIGFLRQGRGLLRLLNERDWGRSDIHIMDGLSLLLVVVVEGRRGG